MTKIHVRTWPGSESASITDMANAGKRGKVCRKLIFRGSAWKWEGDNRAGVATSSVMRLLAKVSGNEINNYYINAVADADFDAVAAQVKAIVAEANADGGLHEWQLATYDETVKGIDAPKVKLVADHPKWGGSADESGISLGDKTDHYNEPRMITPHDQTNAKAYAVAAKVWDRVKEAASMHDAADILIAAGAKLHYYCAID